MGDCELLSLYLSGTGRASHETAISVNMHFLASTIVFMFGDYTGRAVSGRLFLQPLLHTFSPDWLKGELENFFLAHYFAVMSTFMAKVYFLYAAESWISFFHPFCYPVSFY